MSHRKRRRDEPRTAVSNKSLRRGLDDAKMTRLPDIFLNRGILSALGRTTDGLEDAMVLVRVIPHNGPIAGQ